MCDIVTSLSDCMDQIFGKLVAAVMEHSVCDENESASMEKTHIHARDSMMQPKYQKAGHNIKEKKCDEPGVRGAQGTMDKINPDCRGNEIPGYKFREKNSLGKAVVTKISKTVARTIADRKRTAAREGQRKHRRRKKRWRRK